MGIQDSPEVNDPQRLSRFLGRNLTPYHPGERWSIKLIRALSERGFTIDEYAHLKFTRYLRRRGKLES